MAFSKHVTHYGPWSDFLHYKMTTLHRTGISYLSSPGVTMSSSVGLRVGNLHQYSGHGSKIKSQTIVVIYIYILPVYTCTVYATVNLYNQELCIIASDDI